MNIKDTVVITLDAIKDDMIEIESVWIHYIHKRYDYLTAKRVEFIRQSWPDSSNYAITPPTTLDQPIYRQTKRQKPNTLSLSHNRHSSRSTGMY